MQIQQQSKKGRYRNYVKDWDTFLDRAVELAQLQPFTTRMTIKYHHQNNRCVIKVTDGQRVILRKTTQQQDFEQIEKVCLVMARIMSGVNDWQEPKQIKQEKPQKQAKRQPKKKKGK